MPHVHRFYIDPSTSSDVPIRLDGAEAHHALHVVRVRVGDEVSCFDGTGREVAGQVTAVDRASVVVDAGRVEVVDAARIHLTLAQAWLHRDKAVEELVKRGTELGVARFVFFRGDRSERAPNASDKWTRWAIDSCKQCGRSRLPAFSVAENLDAALADAGDIALIATQHRASTPIRKAVSGDHATLIVGPEGDFSDAELGLADTRGALPVSLGDATFRSEVAASVLAALVLYEMGGIGPR